MGWFRRKLSVDAGYFENRCLALASAKVDLQEKLGDFECLQLLAQKTQKEECLRTSLSHLQDIVRMLADGKLTFVRDDVSGVGTKKVA